ncbi:MAG: aspartate kinase [Treponema sp.]|jgi:aspartate kinase|nr:aspartate kinase [Treponema sp.]
MIVMKFGGSSVANAERIRYIAGIVRSQIKRKPVLVLSAMGDTTDLLLQMAKQACGKGKFSAAKIEDLHLKTMNELKLGEESQKEIKVLLDELGKLLTGIALIRELTPKTKDYLVSFGERLSVRIAVAYFNKIKIKATAYDAWDIGFISNSDYGNAELLKQSWDSIPKKILPLVEKGEIPVVTGFIAKEVKGAITTLGRGGSDLSAAMIAAACKAVEVQFWKDVDGILTADPSLIKNASPVKTISYEAAAELAYFGAQILHPRAMQPCMKTGTPVVVKNSYNPDAPGTRILPSMEKKQQPLQAISSRRNVILVDIVSTRMLGQYGFLAEVFACFAKHCLSIDMVATSEVSVSLTLDGTYDLTALKKDLSRIASVEIKTGKAIISIIGDVRRSSEILARSFRICELLGVTVQMISQGASKLNISFIVDDNEAADVIKALHEDFFESHTPGEKP